MSLTIKGKSTDKNYITNLESRGLTLHVDEPIEKGGLDTAMTPMELIGAALSSCTIITLQMYFNHKGWDFKKVETEVTYDYSKIPILFERHVKVNGNFDEKQISVIERVANTCPVHKVLEQGHEIKTTIEYFHSDYIG